MHHLISELNFPFQSIILVLISLLHSQLISHVLVYLHHHHSHQPVFTLLLYMEIFSTNLSHHALFIPDHSDSLHGLCDWFSDFTCLAVFYFRQFEIIFQFLMHIVRRTLTICPSDHQSVHLSHEWSMPKYIEAF